MERFLTGKHAVVTGGTRGIGRAIAEQLLRAGAAVAICGRTQAPVDRAVADLKQSTGGDAFGAVADVSNWDQVASFFASVESRFGNLDVLVNNAGMSLPTRHVTADGIETVFATNHLGPFLLTNLLLPVLTASAPARVVTVSSGVQAMAKIDFDDLQEVKSYSEIRSYNQSKLANLLFTYELARRLKGTGVTANALEPGFIKTSLKVPFPFSLFSFMRGKPVDGARPTIFLASSPEVEGVTATFFNNKGVATRSSPLSYDEDAAKRLWQVSAELTHLDATEA